MKKICLAILIGLLFFSFAQAETIVLKSGTIVKGKILERTDKYVKVDFRGVPTTFFIGEISNIMSDTPKPSFKTIKITYKTAQRLLGSKGSPVHETLGEKTEYIDAVNNKSRTEEISTTTMGEFQTKDEKLSIFDGRRSYSIDLKRKEGFYIDIEMPEGSEPFVPGIVFPPQSDDKYIVGSEEILGRKCTIYSYIKGSKEWLWSGVTLKDENKGDRTFNLIEATKIEENIPISPDMFKVPQDVTIKSLDASMADGIEKLNSITSSEKIIKKLEDAGVVDMAAAMYDPAAEQKLINAIKNEPSLSEEKKRETIKNFKEMTASTKKEWDKARTKDGKIDLDKAVTVFGEARVKAIVEACKANLKQIEMAKNIWAMDHNKTNSENLAWEDLKEYLPHQPACSGGGTYTIGKIDEPPTCSIKEHNL